jgi:4'-phosphopantetheinyl transferase
MNQIRLSEVFCCSYQIPSKDIRKSKIKNQYLDVYKVVLDEFVDQAPSFCQFLAQDELDRAHRYYFDKDRNQFIISRFFLKSVLSDHTGIPISEITIDHQSTKKPFLASHPSLFFNVSHSGEYALIVVASVPVGIDLEKLDHNMAYDEIAEAVLSSSELQVLEESEDKSRLFLQFWTRKEAISKVSGKGIDSDFDSIPALYGHHKVLPKIVGGISQLTVISFDLDALHVASVAFAGNSNNIKNINIKPFPIIDGNN